jgi:aspartate aminotransferase
MGRDVIGLGAGEPDFDTPGEHQGGGDPGDPGGQDQVHGGGRHPRAQARDLPKFDRENGLAYQPAQVTVGTGGKQVLYNALMATLNPGDEVIVPAPYWVSYPDMVLLAGGTPIFVAAGPEAGFKITPEQLEAAITRGPSGSSSTRRRTPRGRATRRRS